MSNLTKAALGIFCLGLLFGIGYLITHAIESRDPHMKVIFLDVGQGDATFIQSPDGHQVLIDGGDGAQVLSELGRVMKPWDRTIDLVIATHPDKDHIGGLPDVFEKYHVKKYMDAGNWEDAGLVHELKRLVDLEGSEYITSHDDQVIEMGEVVIEVIAASGLEFKDKNDASVMTRIDYGDTSWLLTGDASVAVEGALVREGQPLDVDVLKSGHHGSKTSSSEIFLQAVSPDFIAISAGADNRHGHPHTVVTDRYDFLGIPYLCTCESGRIVTKSDGKMIVVK